MPGAPGAWIDRILASWMLLAGPRRWDCTSPPGENAD
ncbi:hypothetical protein QGN32_12155 [Mycolicibacterium sp. ND9-15]|nr:hypothetical protein [Mycolicibacterium sp. ND9-15]WSE58780.1 hypothetical protein QGN32_12155 [Mycolicibacterium sp. ND9-15]